MKNHNHLIEINEDKRKLSIYRVMPDGEMEFYTSVELPSINAQEDWDSFQSFALSLGENILFDSQTARKLLNL